MSEFNRVTVSMQGRSIVTSGGYVIAHVAGDIKTAKLRAAVIVERWNAYPDLLDALSHLHDAVASPNELSVSEAMENAAKVLRELGKL